MNAKPPYRIAVLASTKGTDLQAIIDELKAGNMPGIELVLVLSNKEHCYALQRAREQGFKAIFVDPKGLSRQKYDKKLVKLLQDAQVDLVCLIGYMRILSPVVIRAFPGRIINVHPALMPKFSGSGFYGKSVHEEVLKANESESGCTIHIVDEGVDTGPILAQAKVTIAPDETPETLKEKVQALEKKLYPGVIRRFARGEFDPVSGG